MQHSFLELVETKMGNNNPFIEKLFQFTGLKELFWIDIQINIYILSYIPGMRKLLLLHSGIQPMTIPVLWGCPNWLLQIADITVDTGMEIL